MSRASNGRGSVHRSKDTTGWEGWVSFGTDPITKKRLRKKVRGRTKAETQAKVDVLTRQRNKRTIPVSQKTTLMQWCDDWYDRHAPAVRENTREGYRTDLSYVRRSGIGSVLLRDVQAQHIEDLYSWVLTMAGPEYGNGKRAKRRCGRGTIDHLSRTLWQPMRLAYEQGYLPNNPVKEAVRPTHDDPEPEPEPYDLEDIPTFLAQVHQHRNGVRWDLSLLGLRTGEATGLRWRDIDWRHGLLRVRHSMNWSRWSHGCSPASRKPDAAETDRYACAADAPCRRSPGRCPQRWDGGPELGPTKTKGSKRSVPIPGAVLARLAQHLIAQTAELEAAGSLWVDWDLVIATPTGGPVDRSTDRRDFERLKEVSFADHPRAHELLDHRIHDLRHTSTTALMQDDVPDRAIMATHGWKTDHELSRYAHVRRELRERVTASQDRFMTLPSADEDSERGGSGPHDA